MKKKITTIFLTATILTSLVSGCGKDNKDTDKEAYRQYGINCIENGDYEEAVSAFQKALDQSVGSVGQEELDICYYKAKAQFLSGDVDSAIETYTAIIEYNDDADAYFLRGAVYFSQEKKDKGMKDFEAAINEEEDNYEIYIGIHDTLLKYGMIDEANSYLERALKIEGDDGYDYMNRGRINAIMGDYESSVKNLKKAVDKKEEKANYYLGQTYLLMDDKENAKASYKAYIDSGNADSYDLNSIGQAQMDDGQYETAVTYFEAALELEEVPNKQTVMKNLIIAYEYSGDFQKAKIKMKEYLDKYPDDEDAIREKEFLETR